MIWTAIIRDERGEYDEFPVFTDKVDFEAAIRRTLEIIDPESSIVDIRATAGEQPQGE